MMKSLYFLYKSNANETPLLLLYRAVAGYDKDAKDKIVLEATGTGSLDELAGHFHEGLGSIRRQLFEPRTKSCCEDERLQR